MRLVLQRVLNASVIVDGAVVGSIEKGILIFLGFSFYDTPSTFPLDVACVVKKVLNARLFPSKEGKQWAASAASEKLPLLLVSQFTLHGNLRKPKPDFHKSAKTDEARGMYNAAVSAFQDAHGKDLIATGIFAADMEVKLSNWGPVTLTFDTANRKELYWEEEEASKEANAASASCSGGGGGGGGASTDTAVKQKEDRGKLDEN